MKKVAVFVGHRAVWILVWGMLLSLVWDLLVAEDGTEGDFTWATVLGLIFFFGLLVTMYVHGRNPCMTCLRKMPLDPAAHAHKKARWLRLHHLSQSGWVVLAVLGVWLLGVWMDRQDIWDRVNGWTALPVVAFVVAEVVHSKYFLWCPQCRRDDDGDSSSLVGPDGDGIEEPK